jgi:hypothetical protein
MPWSCSKKTNKQFIFTAFKHKGNPSDLSKSWYNLKGDDFIEVQKGNQNKFRIDVGDTQRMGNKSPYSYSGEPKIKQEENQARRKENSKGGVGQTNSSFV